VVLQAIQLIADNDAAQDPQEFGHWNMLCQAPGKPLGQASAEIAWEIAVRAVVSTN